MLVECGRLGPGDAVSQVVGSLFAATAARTPLTSVGIQRSGPSPRACEEIGGGSG